MAQAKDIYNNIWIRIFILLALFISAYWIPLKGIVNTWITNDDYSYGFLIPVISLYLLWDKRSDIKEAALKSSWGVLPILIFFVLLSLYGVLGSSGHISRPAIPVLVILFASFCFGIGLTRKIILPLGFLIFMVPLPTVLDRTIGVFLKTVSSQLGGMFIRAFGFSVHVSGNIIDLGVTKLQVVDACSGLRFVFPLLALGVVYSYLFERVAWKQIVCVLATIPIAILTNVLRIGITGVLTYYYGSKVAEGFFHGFSGWTIFMVAFVFIFLLGRILRFFPPKMPKVKSDKVPDVKEIQPSNSDKRTWKGAFVTSVLILIAVVGITLNTQALPPITINGGIESFPLQFEGWVGRKNPVDPEIVIASGAEEAFSASYGKRGNEQVALYIGYRSTAFLENENFFHSPTVCLPSSGWKTIEKSTHTITNIPFYGNVKVTRMVIELFGTKQLVYFWFQTKDKATHDKNINRFHLAVHAIKMDNTHDLFIRPITPIKEGETAEAASARLDQFVRDMMAPLLRFLSENQITG